MIKRIYTNSVQNAIKKQDELLKIGYKSLPFCDNFRENKYKNCQKINIYGKRWHGEWTGYGSHEIIAQIYKEI